MRRLRYWLLRLRLVTARWSARMPRVPRRAVRNILLFWLFIIAAVGLVVGGRRSPEGFGPLIKVQTQRWHAVVDKANDALPRMDDIVLGERELAGAALKLALPVAMSRDGQRQDQSLSSWKWIVRRVARAVAGVDIGDPAAMLAFGLPGFDDYVLLAGDASLPSSARAMMSPTPDPRPPTSPAPTSGPSPTPPRPFPPSSPSPPEDVPAPSLKIEPTRPSADEEPLPGSTPDSPLDRLRAVAWGDDCRVLIYHTHTSEMYRTDTFAPPNPQDYHLFNTTETGIVAVGRAMKNHLEQLGIPTCHLTNVHDWPSHPRAYIEARATVEQFLRRHPHVDIVLDVHRDAPAGLVTTIGGRRAAQIAFVLGTHSRMHPGWPENAAFGRALADLLEERFPGLFRRIIERPESRLNQDLHPRSILVEIGSYDTSLDEALVSAELFAEVVADMLHVIRFGRSVMDRTLSF